MYQSYVRKAFWPDRCPRYWWAGGSSFHSKQGRFEWGQAQVVAQEDAGDCPTFGIEFEGGCVYKRALHLNFKLEASAVATVLASLSARHTSALRGPKDFFPHPPYLPQSCI